MSRQYVAVQFKPGGRPYTYHNEGPPVSIGDRVKLENRDGIVTVTVSEISDTPPPFATKPIIGLADAELI